MSGSTPWTAGGVTSKRCMATSNGRPAVCLEFCRILWGALVSNRAPLGLHPLPMCRRNARPFSPRACAQSTIAVDCCHPYTHHALSVVRSPGCTLCALGRSRGRIRYSRLAGLCHGRHPSIRPVEPLTETRGCHHALACQGTAAASGIQSSADVAWRRHSGLAHFAQCGGDAELERGWRRIRLQFGAAGVSDNAAVAHVGGERRDGTRRPGGDWRNSEVHKQCIGDPPQASVVTRALHKTPAATLACPWP